ncbi:MAG: chloride channel protein [Levilactobacillus sp.]|jgi:H+/Cl- antiporter ClcA|uniref:ClC family H(+)/Cl(-) exchange transporter n=1 Tax=Levilactobacillus sp. TaxID=2767919 RepID=UPI00258D1C9A|nr:ClC family H(+)/Cl(-) exchange transporter [Levilactobacillus sp.]MCH4124015.1 chloride channel protein [Levilactobacillus sp.]MCI1554149.1 chloride channel protein [Levilactobacillus sp.]MCI1599912.1 chloride channel protein [Levilactobacillus sp.]
MKRKQRTQHDFTRLSAIFFGSIVGLLAGAVVSTFRLAIEHLLKLMQSLYGWFGQNPLWLIPWALLLVAIAVLIGHWTKQTPMIKGSGIPQVEGQLAGELDYAWWPVLWKKFVSGILGIGAGLFLGREGPSIQLGGTVAQGVAEGFRFKGSQRRLLIAGGAAAGLSAAFNAPIASTLFILEEVYHNFSTLVWLTSLTSAVVANFVSNEVFGLTPVLHITYQSALPLRYYGLLLLLGIGLGLLGYVYQWATLNGASWYAKITWLPKHLDGIIPFLLVIPIGLLWPVALGGGNGMIVLFAKHTPLLLPLIGYFILRFCFSTISYSSGLPGGIFLPILALGALLGAIGARLFVAVGWLPQIYVANLIIYAMAGYFAGISKAPFTAILLITEMVGTLHHLMPLAVVAIVAYITVDVLGGAPIYEAMLEQMVKPAQAKDVGPTDRIEFAVNEGTDLVGKQVRDIVWPTGSLLVSVRRGERAVIPHGDTILRAGDMLVIFTYQNNRAYVRQQLTHLNDSSGQLPD